MLLTGRKRAALVDGPKSNHLRNQTYLDHRGLSRKKLFHRKTIEKTTSVKACLTRELIAIKQTMDNAHLRSLEHAVVERLYKSTVGRLKVLCDVI